MTLTRSHVLALATATVALGAPALADAAALDVGAACTYSGAPLQLSGSGFSPNATVTLSGAASGTATTDATGSFSHPFRAPASPSLTGRTATIHATEGAGAGDPAHSAQVKVKVVKDLLATNAPISGSPGGVTVWRFAGFEPGRPIYGHYRFKGRTLRNYRFGLASGPCGTLTVAGAARAHDLQAGELDPPARPAQGLRAEHRAAPDHHLHDRPPFGVAGGSPPRGTDGGRWAAAVPGGLQAASVMARTSSSLRAIPAAATFSSRWATEPVPGIGSITGERCSSHASATCAGVAPCALGERRPAAPPGSARSPAASGNHGMKPMPCCLAVVQHVLGAAVGEVVEVLHRRDRRRSRAPPRSRSTVTSESADVADLALVAAAPPARRTAPRSGTWGSMRCSW